MVLRCFVQKLDDFITVPPSGILYAKLDQGDFIKDIIIAHSNFNLIVYSDRKAVSVNVNDIPYLLRPLIPYHFSLDYQS